MDRRVQQIDWTKGLDGAFLCWFGYSVLYPSSAFLGLALLGVGSLLVGIAFGRE
ncbi:MAG TPA: hypothetical protein VK914_01070 [bacterium]|jgi:hypothetical protein|nr:hypothetical protein [bacterium]